MAVAYSLLSLELSGPRLILALVVATGAITIAAFYYEALAASGREFRVNVGDTMFSGYVDKPFVSDTSFFLLLGRGDSLVIDVRGSNIERARLLVEVVNLRDGSKAVFEGEFLYELLGPKLVAPEESLYRVRVLVEAWAGSQGSGELSISAYGVQGDRGEVVRRLPILGLVFAVILVVLYRSLGRRGPSLTGFILGSSGLWVFYPVILALYMASVVNLDSSGPTLLQSLLGPVAVGESKGFILSVIVSTGIASVALFSYARESGLEVAEAVIGYSRPRLFAYKVASILLLSFAPVVAAMALVYLVWLPGLAASKPGIVLRVLGLEALYYLLLTIMFLGYFTLVSVLVPWTLLSLALSIIPVAALLAGAFGGSLLSPLDLVAGADPLVRGWGFLDFSVMGGLSLSETALASLALLAVSYLIYTTRSYG